MMTRIKYIIFVNILMSILMAYVHVEIRNVDIDAGTLDIHMINQASCSSCSNEDLQYDLDVGELWVLGKSDPARKLFL